MRQTVNNWIRSSGEFDAVIDFDAAVRDPAAPTQLLGTYDSGDHIHPSDAGYSAGQCRQPEPVRPMTPAQELRPSLVGGLGGTTAVTTRRIASIA
jgi:hypothetical protein